MQIVLIGHRAVACIDRCLRSEEPEAAVQEPPAPAQTGHYKFVSQHLPFDVTAATIGS